MATNHNLYVDQGASYTHTLELIDSNNVAIDLTNYSVKGAIKKTYTATHSVWFSSSIPVPTNGHIVISLDELTTAGMDAARYQYDVFITDNMNITTKVLEGQLTINPSVTPGA